MKRKVIALSGSTLVLTLPTGWTKKYSIKRGDELSVDESGTTLTIRTSPQKAKKERDIDIRGAHPMIKRILGALYKQGYDAFKVIFKTEEEKYIAEDVVANEFVGFEVTDSTKTSLTVHKVSDIDYEGFDKILRRLFLVIKEISEKCLESISDHDKAKMKVFIAKDNEVNKLADFCRRILNKRGYDKPYKTPPMYYISEELEKVADHFKEIMKLQIESEKSPSKALLEFHKEVNSFYNQFYELFYKFDLTRMAEFGRKRKELNKRGAELFPKVSHEEAALLHHLLSTVEQVFDMNGPLMAIQL